MMRVLLASLLLILAACSSEAGPTATPVPTSTPFPTREHVAPTAPPLFATLAAATVTAEAAGAAGGIELDPVLVERGRGRYEALECASCHGDQGEGTDDGPALTGMELTEAQFIDYMRSGGSIGVDHQYSTDRLSASGGRNLYFYLLSLGSE